MNTHRIRVIINILHILLNDFATERDPAIIRLIEQEIRSALRKLGKLAEDTQ